MTLDRTFELAFSGLFTNFERRISGFEYFFGRCLPTQDKPAITGFKLSWKCFPRFSETQKKFLRRHSCESDRFWLKYFSLGKHFLAKRIIQIFRGSVLVFFSFGAIQDTTFLQMSRFLPQPEVFFPKVFSVFMQEGEVTIRV